MTIAITRSATVPKRIPQAEFGRIPGTLILHPFLKKARQPVVIINKKTFPQLHPQSKADTYPQEIEEINL